MGQTGTERDRAGQREIRRERRGERERERESEREIDRKTTRTKGETGQGRARAERDTGSE